MQGLWHSEQHDSGHRWTRWICWRQILWSILECKRLKPVTGVTPRRWQAECSNLCTPHRNYCQEKIKFLHPEGCPWENNWSSGSSTTAWWEVRGSLLWWPVVAFYDRWSSWPASSRSRMTTLHPGLISLKHPSHEIVEKLKVQVHGAQVSSFSKRLNNITHPKC